MNAQEIAKTLRDKGFSAEVSRIGLVVVGLNRPTRPQEITDAVPAIGPARVTRLSNNRFVIIPQEL